MQNQTKSTRSLDWQRHLHHDDDDGGGGGGSDSDDGENGDDINDEDEKMKGRKNEDGEDNDNDDGQKDGDVGGGGGGGEEERDEEGEAVGADEGVDYLYQRHFAQRNQSWLQNDGQSQIWKYYLKCIGLSYRNFRSNTCSRNYPTVINQTLA